MQSAIRARNLTFPIRGAIDNFKMPADAEYREWLEPAIASFLTGEPIARPETASFGCAIETAYYRIPGRLVPPPQRRSPPARQMLSPGKRPHRHNTSLAGDARC